MMFGVGVTSVMPTRPQAEAKVARILEEFREEELALLYSTMHTGAGWRLERAVAILKRAKWWLP